jgi:hypothetical protein
MTVPATVAGLDALVVAMVLAGAIEAPEPDSLVSTKGGGTRVEVTSQSGSRYVHTAAGAFATGLALIERAGHVAGWRA